MPLPCLRVPVESAFLIFLIIAAPNGSLPKCQRTVTSSSLVARSLHVSTTAATAAATATAAAAAVICSVPCTASDGCLPTGSRAHAFTQYSGGHMVQVDSQQPTVMYTQPPARSRKFSTSNARAIVWLGSVQLSIGILCIIFQSVATNLEAAERSALNYNWFTSEFVGAGIWCGGMFFVTGILGIVSGKKNGVGAIIAFMVMCILSCLFVWVLLGFSSANLATVNSCVISSSSKSYSSSDSYNSYITYDCRYSIYSSWVAMDGLLLALALIEFVIAITSSALCCKAACDCCGTTAYQSQSTVVMTQQPTVTYFPTQHPMQISVGLTVHPGQGLMTATTTGPARDVQHMEAPPAYPGHSEQPLVLGGMSTSYSQENRLGVNAGFVQSPSDPCKEFVKPTKKATATSAAHVNVEDCASYQHLAPSRGAAGSRDVYASRNERPESSNTNEEEYYGPDYDLPEMNFH